jgi:hypothetical protein
VDEESSAMTPQEKASIEAAVDAALADDSAPTARVTTTSEAGFPWVGGAGLLAGLVAAVVLVARSRRRA